MKSEIQSVYTPWVSVVLLNYNGYQDTIECIESLLGLEYKQFNIIVVDNQSPDQSLTFLHQWLQKEEITALFLAQTSTSKEQLHLHLDKPDSQPVSKENFGKYLLTTIQAGSNLGFAGGNNIGIRHALEHFSPAYVWLLNNDTVVAPDSLSHLVNRAQNEQSKGGSVGIWGSKLLYYHQPDTVQAIGGKLNLNTLTTSHIAEGLKDGPALNMPNLDLDYVVGASIFVSKTFLEDVGLLNTDYFLYFEELDWATRGRAKGYSLDYVWESRVFHKEGQAAGSSSSGGKKSNLADYHGLRSKIIFFSTYHPQKRLKLYLSLLGSIVLRLMRRDVTKALQVVKLMINPKQV